MPEALLSSEEMQTAGTNKKMNKKKGPHTFALINAPIYFDFNEELFSLPRLSTKNIIVNEIISEIISVSNVII